MLVLSRYRNQDIIIGNSLVTIHTVDIREDKVRLGITAPRCVPVHRAEVLAAINRSGGLPAGPTLQQHGQRTIVLTFPDDQSYRAALAAGVVQFASPAVITNPLRKGA